MKIALLTVLGVLLFVPGPLAQTPVAAKPAAARPKLIVLISVDQMRGDNRGNRLGHARPRAGTSLVGGRRKRVFPMFDGKVGPRFAIADCAPGGRNSALHRSKQCAIVYMAKAMSILENRPILSIAWLI